MSRIEKTPPLLRQFEMSRIYDAKGRWYHDNVIITATSPRTALIEGFSWLADRRRLLSAHPTFPGGGRFDNDLVYRRPMPD